MKIKELILDEEEETGVFAISFVDFPAIESNFIALNKEGKTQYSLAQVNEEKRLVVGAALIPNKMILRKDAEDNPYQVYFSTKTVKETAYRFLKASAHHNFTVQHESEVDGNYMVESWIVEDETHDKSRKYGINAPIGTWMVAIKVENDKLWNEYIKEKKARGFSIEAYFVEKMKAKEKKESSLPDELSQHFNKIFEVLEK